jgi:xylulokinase
MEYLLGIDIGTSGTKTCLIRYDGVLVASAFAEYSLQQPKPNWAEQNPEDWWKAVKQTIHHIFKQLKIVRTEIKGIGLSGQMHGLVILDRNRQVLRPSIIWCDQRTQEEVSWLEEEIGVDKVIQYTSNPPLTNFTATKLLWVKKHEPSIYSRIDKVLLPKDYIRYKLTNEFATEVSDASGTLFFDVKNRCWSEEMIRKLEINYEWLPQVHESLEVSGKVCSKGAMETGLAPGTPVVGGGGDQAAGAIGNGIVQSGLVSVSLGTSGVVFAPTDEMTMDKMGRVHSFCHAIPNKWHVMGVTQSAGGSLQWFRNQFGHLEKELGHSLGKGPYELFSEQAAKIEPGSEGLLFLPYLMGERTPHLDPEARGVFFGISARHERMHFIRSIMEGVSYSLNDSVALMKELGVPIREVRVSGGGGSSETWRRILADMINQDIYIIQTNEGPAFGAALLAGAGIRVFKSVEEACQETISKSESISPKSENVRIYEDYYQIFRKIYDDLRDNFKRLNEVVAKSEIRH